MSNILLGFQTVATPGVLLFLVIGCVVGLVIGALPGLTGNMAIALMVPMTFGMEPSVGLAFLAAIYCSSIFGGSFLPFSWESRARSQVLPQPWTAIHWRRRARRDWPWEPPPWPACLAACSALLCCCF